MYHTSSYKLLMFNVLGPCTCITSCLTTFQSSKEITGAMVCMNNIEVYTSKIVWQKKDIEHISVNGC